MFVCCSSTSRSTTRRRCSSIPPSSRSTPRRAPRRSPRCLPGSSQTPQLDLQVCPPNNIMILLRICEAQMGFALSWLLSTPPLKCMSHWEPLPPACAASRHQNNSIARKFYTRGQGGTLKIYIENSLPLAKNNPLLQSFICPCYFLLCIPQNVLLKSFEVTLVAVSLQKIVQPSPPAEAGNLPSPPKQPEPGHKNSAPRCQHKPKKEPKQEKKRCPQCHRD